MKIGLVSFHTCPMADLGEKDAGGMNVYLLNLAAKLDSMGHTVHVFTRSHEHSEDSDMPLGTRSKLVHISAGPIESPKNELINLVFEFSRNIQIYAEYEGLYIDILHSHYWLSGLVGDLLSESWEIPHVITFHTLAKTKSRALPVGDEHTSRSASEYKLMCRSDKILVLTQKEVQDIDQLYGSFSNKVAVVPPGVDLEMFHQTDKDAARNQLNIPRQNNMVLFVGRIDPIKGLDVLIKALSMVSSVEDTTLYIVGGNEESNEYYRSIKSLVIEMRLDDKVIFTGAIAHDNLATYYSAADVFVLPSHYESLGFVVIEAMACGTPVVASRVGGIPSIVEHGSTGYLIPWRCPEAFATQIEVLLKNKDLHSFMSKEAIKKAYSLSWDASSKKAADLYGEVISGSVNTQVI
tara:strand:- start:1159 stop:2379 length:1221 start_codon:yes stop_codon:yes gene_type:complete